MGDGHDDDAGHHLMTVCELDVVLGGAVVDDALLGLGEAVVHEDVDPFSAEALERAVLGVVGEVLGGEELVAGVGKGDAGAGLDDADFRRHLYADGAAADDEDGVPGVEHGVDVLLGLEEVLLAVQRLGHDGPGAAQARGGDEVVVGVGCGLPRDGRGYGGGLGGGGDGGDGALEDGDVGVLQGGDVVEFHPALFGVLGVGEGEGAADEVDWGLSVYMTSALTCKKTSL